MASSGVERVDPYGVGGSRLGTARRRWRKATVRAIVVLAVLLGLLIGADRVGAWAAEQMIAEQSAAQMRQLGVASQQPEVTIGGFPFLTQVARGRYEEISIVLRDVHKDGLRLPVLDVRATGVDAKLGTLLSQSGHVTARQVTGVALVGYDSVRDLIAASIGRLDGQGVVAIAPGLRVFEQDGRLRLEVPVTVAGQPATAVATGVVRIEDDTLQLAVSEVQVQQGTLPPQAQRLLDRYLDGFTAQVTVPPLPFRLRIDHVQPRPDGLAIRMTAESVPLGG